jgi:hypothetical protein
MFPAFHLTGEHVKDPIPYPNLTCFLQVLTEIQNDTNCENKKCKEGEKVNMCFLFPFHFLLWKVMIFFSLFCNKTDSSTRLTYGYLY